MQISQIVTEQHRRLLELSRDIERNEADHEFAKSGRKIHYLFDENVFEFFYGANNHSEIQLVDSKSPELEHSNRTTSYWDKRHFSSIFHTHTWRENFDRDSAEDAWISINRQISIATAEYLVSGELPGQQNSSIFMTQWHWNEFVFRRNLLRNHFKELQTNDVISKTYESGEGEKNRRDNYIALLIEVASLSKSENIDYHKLLEFGREKRLNSIAQLEADVASLKSDGVDKLEIRSQVVSRIIADVVASDDIVSAFEMILRTDKDEVFQKNLKPIFLLGNIPSQNSVIARAKKWMKRISQEIELSKFGTRRKKGSLDADAYSLAYVDLLSEKLGDDEQVCLVTGDNLVFDTYRRWWVNNSEKPFILRRVAQYAPFLNFGVASNSKADKRDIFDKIQLALEPALMYFNLGFTHALSIKLSQETADSEYNFPEIRSAKYNVGREYLALLLRSYSGKTSPGIQYFINTKAAGTFDEKRSALNSSSLVHLRQVERQSIVIAERFILKRYNQLPLAELKKTTESHVGFLEYIEQRLDDLYGTFALHYIPMVTAQIQTWLRESKIYSINRVPLVVDYELYVGENTAPSDVNSNQDIRRLADELLGLSNNELDARIPELLTGKWIVDCPAIVFALASVLALRLQLWEEATEYAENARRISETRYVDAKSSSPEDPCLYWECVYLHCLARRFSMGVFSYSLPTSVSVRKSIIFDLNESKNGYEQLCATAPEFFNRASINRARADSEAAATSLFYVGRLLCSTSSDEDLTKLTDSVTEILDGVLNDLISAQQRLQEVQTDARVKQLTVQISCNSASAYTLRMAFKIKPISAENKKQSSFFSSVFKNLNEMESYDTLSESTQVEIHTFIKSFRGGDGGSKPFVSNHKQGKTNHNLQIDTELVQKYSELLK